MPKLLLFSAKEVCKALERAGFTWTSQKGSHIKYKKHYEGTSRTVIIPNYSEIPKGTFKAILKQAGMSLEDFLKLLK